MTQTPTNSTSNRSNIQSTLNYGDNTKDRPDCTPREDTVGARRLGLSPNKQFADNYDVILD